MPAPVSVEIHSFRDFINQIEAIKLATPGPVWYRGIKNSSFRLSPSLFRHSHLVDINQLIPLEAQLVNRFLQRSIPFHSRVFRDDWDVIFFMQHFGVPTRLLDWTENPFFALFFATMFSEFRITRTGTEYLHDSVVWVIDPVLWNQHALSFKSFSGGILSQIDHDLDSYKPGTEIRHMNNHPVAIYGAHNSPRIVAQRGAFTVFGKKTDAMEKLYEDDAFPGNCLRKLDIKRDAIGDIRKALVNYGITDSVIFPDLDGLAREIRREFQYEV